MPALFTLKLWQKPGTEFFSSENCRLTLPQIKCIPVVTQKPYVFNNAVDFLNRLRSTFYIMVGIPLLVFLAVYLSSREGSYPVLWPSIPAFLLYMVPAVCLLVCVYAYLIYYKELRQIRKLPSLQQKLQQLFALDIKKFWLLEGATILTLLLYVLSAHTVFAGLYIVMLILFAMNNPSYYNVTGDLKLSKEERSVMRNNKPIQ